MKLYAYNGPYGGTHCQIAVRRTADPPEPIVTYFLEEDSPGHWIIKRHPTDGASLDYRVVVDLVKNRDDSVVGRTFRKAVLDSPVAGVHKELLQAIREVFRLSGVQPYNLFSSAELRPCKATVTRSRYRTLQSYDTLQLTSWISTNVSAFLRESRLHAALSFVMQVFTSLEWGFLCSPGPPIAIHTRNVTWRMSHPYDVNDPHGEIASLLFSHAVDLIGRMPPPTTPLLLLRSALSTEFPLSLTTANWLGLLQAAMRCGDRETLELALARARAKEPTHPAIAAAEAQLRRTSVLSALASSCGGGILKLETLSGHEFEVFLEQQFSSRGFRVVRTKGSGDFGADLIAETQDGTRAAIQAKRHNRQVNLKAVQEIVAALPHYGADFGIVVATAGFFPSAVALAKANDVELWDEDSLLRFLGGDTGFSQLSLP